MDLIFVQNFFYPFFSLHQSARIETCARSFENIQNSPRSVILCIHRLADRPIDTLSLLFTWSGLRARIFSAIRITVPVTGKYRNEFPFNFSLPSSPFIQPSPPVSRYLPLLSFHSLSFSRICLLQLDGSREQTFKRIETRGSARWKIVYDPEARTP